jgi:hypothetical protein
MKTVAVPETKRAATLSMNPWDKLESLVILGSCRNDNPLAPKAFIDACDTLFGNPKKSKRTRNVREIMDIGLFQSTKNA